MYDVIIIGGGPAGLAAGIYAARGGRKAAVLEKTSTGGQAATTPEIENYPGIDSISGFELCYAMMKQCEKFGVEFIFDEATEIIAENEEKKVIAASGATYAAKALIVTTGASPRKLGLDGEERLLGSGVSYCATCDGAFFKDKTVAVAGGGNTAAEDAIYLKKFAKKVYLIHRRNELRATKILGDKVLSEGVEVIWDTVVTELKGNPKLTEITLKNVKTDVLTSLSVDGLFVAVGNTPQSDGFDPLEKTPSGYIKTDREMRTNIDGVFAAGDVIEKSLRQVVTACADGAIAAESALKYLS